VLIALLSLLGGALLLPTSELLAKTGVEGSDHDFSKTNYIVWNTRRGVCTPCHTAHNTDPAQLAPLWAHQTTSASFQMYSSPTIKYTPGTAPDGVSLACLSCHDGTLGINSPIGGLGTNVAYYVPAGKKLLGTDLHTSHPISFVYDSALAAADGQLEDPTTYHVGDPKTRLTVQTPPVPTTWAGTSLSGKSIDVALLVDHKVQCTSCHDPHWIKGSTPLGGTRTLIDGLDSDSRGSLICLTCHIK
jgi:hypothetical protein